MPAISIISPFWALIRACLMACFLSEIETVLAISFTGIPFSISSIMLKQCLLTLENLKLIEYKNGIYHFLIDTTHLSKDSPLFSAHKTLLKQLVNQYLQQYKKDTDYNLSITFTADEESFHKIKAGFLSLLSEYDKIIENSKCENVWHLNFDLFSWSKE